MKRRNALAILAGMTGIFGVVFGQTSSKAIAKLIPFYKKDCNQTFNAFGCYDYERPQTLRIELDNIEEVQVWHNGKMKIIKPQELFDAL